jgi:phosphate transport system substrate-binding protein
LGLDEKKFAPSMKPYKSDPTDSIRSVGRTPGGIGYATASEVCNQDTIRSLEIYGDGQGLINPCIKEKIDTNEVNTGAIADRTYPITRPLFIIIREDISSSREAGEAYANLLLSDEGQRLMERAGLAKIPR